MAKHGTEWTETRCKEARRLYEERRSLDEIASAMRSNNVRVSAAIRRAGGTIRRKGPRSEKNRFWKGGRHVDKHGYVLLHCPEHPNSTDGGYVREHRLVMEQVLGRYLTPQEVVHHKNGIPDDNRPENLELFATNAEHLAQELKGRCPKWTEAGLASLRRSADLRRGQRLTTTALPKSDEQESPLLIHRFSTPPEASSPAEIASEETREQ